MKKNKYSGSSFDDFLKAEGIYEEVKTLAQKELASERYNAIQSLHGGEHDTEGEDEHN